MIRATELSKLYDDHLAVDGLSVDLRPGQICGLVGPNGAGKTTTLRCLAGLIKPSEGDLIVAGYNLSRQLAESKRDVAYVPDDPPLFDDLSVGQHMDLIGRLYQIPDFRTKSAELLAQFALLEKYDAGATTLSRGMRQKLAVCCAYLSEPKVLLLDEPLTGLDPPGIRTLLASIRRRAAEGTTVVISSHLLAMIDDVVTHLLVMQDGKSQYFGIAQDLRRQYPYAETLEQAYFAATRDPADSVMPITDLSTAGKTASSRVTAAFEASGAGGHSELGIHDSNYDGPAAIPFGSLAIGNPTSSEPSC